MWASQRDDVLALHGEVDLATGDLLAERLMAAIDRDAPAGDVCVDFADVTFIDVTGTRIVVAAAKHLGPDRRLVIRRPPGLLERILDVGWGHVPGLLLEDTPVP